jgi:hypothetical protein
MKANVTGDKGEWVCSILANLSEGEGLQSKNGELRVRIGCSQYLLRQADGEISVWESQDWPHDTKGVRVHVQMNLNVTK